jgi:hypothetical protein
MVFGFFFGGGGGGGYKYVAKFNRKYSVAW